MNDTDKSKYRQKHERSLAKSALVDYQIYLALGEREHDPVYRELFTELAQVAKEHFNFWGRKANQRGDAASKPLFVFFCIVLRRLLGARRTARFIVGRERAKIDRFEVYCVDCLDTDEKKAINAMIARSLSVIAAIDKGATAS